LPSRYAGPEPDRTDLAVARVDFVRPMARSWLLPSAMPFRTESALEIHLAELSMRDFFPCDLGDGIEVIHDVELVEIEMDCADDDSAPYESIEIDYLPEPIVHAVEERAVVELGLNGFVRSPVWDTLPFSPFEPSAVLAKGTGPVACVDDPDAVQTMPFARVLAETVPYPKYSAPYERIDVAELKPRR